MRKPFWFSALVLVAVFCLWVLAAGPNLRAAPAVITFTVDNPNDLKDDDTSDGVCTPGLCSLRAAIMQANRMSPASVDIILPSGIYTLTRPIAGADGDDSGDLNLTAPTSGSPLISIIGAGAATTIIDGNQLDRIFNIESGSMASISGVTVRGGYISGNTGGGIHNAGILMMSNNMIRDNQTKYVGGGIANSGTLTLIQSTIRQNHANGHGGGIYNANGSLTISQSTISENTAGYNGAGIDNVSTLFVLNSTLSGNQSNAHGGGIYNAHDAINVYNTTIVFNEADADAVGGGLAGGVYNEDVAGATFNLINTVLAGNSFGGVTVYDECYGTLHSYGTNRIGMLTQTNICGVTQVGTGSFFPLNSPSTLGPLQNNGGPTWTHALLAGSNAIDAGDPTVGCVDQTYSPLATDQRGAPRIFGVRCDIGAFEYRTPLYLPLIRR